MRTLRPWILLCLCVAVSSAGRLQCEDIPEERQIITCRFLSPVECEDLVDDLYPDCKKSCGWCDGKPIITTTTTTTTKEPTSKPSPMSRKVTPTPVPPSVDPPTWGKWQPTGPCSLTCGTGFGKQARVRECSSGVQTDCKGKAKKMFRCKSTIACPTQTAPVGVWGEWEVEECNVECGPGVKISRRKCTAAGGCLSGESERAEDCFKICAEVEAKPWDACSKACGHGHRWFENCTTINDCKKYWSDCQKGLCATDDCSAAGKHLRIDKTKCCEYSPNSQCGKDPASARIIGGTIAQKWPWVGHAVIPTGRGTNELCGLTLINKDWALTAGHCLHDKVWRSMSMYFGTSNLLATGDSKAQVRQAQNIIIHPEFNSSLVADIALIKLNESVEINDDVQTICLPNDEELQIDASCIAVGWGQVDWQRIVAANELRQVKLYNYPYDVCKDVYKDDKFGPSMDGRQLCVGRLSGGADTCNGDSGGALMCQRCSYCNWYIAGVTSFGQSQCGVAGKPGVYAKVNDYSEWINENVEGLEGGSYSCK